MTCPSCLRAQQAPAHADYVPGCLGCQIRRLVHLPPEQREAQLDRIRFACGDGAKSEAIRLIELERARIKKLRGEPARKERA